jgi:hypothetical protein
LSRFLVCALLAASLGFQGPESLITSARRLGGEAQNGLDVELTFVPFGTIVANSQIIVRGYVRSISSRLSADERWVLTQYEVTPTRFFKGSTPQLSRPGQTQPVLVTHIGGTLEIDGLHLSSTVDIYPAADFLRPGDDVILFLSPAPLAAGCFSFEGGPFGAFRVTGGMVAAMSSELRRNHQDEAFTQFEQRLNALLAR